MKDYKEFITELKSSTLYSAASKAKEYGQNTLSKKFIDHKKKSEWTEKKNKDLFLSIIDRYMFDYYVYEVTESQTGRDQRVDNVVSIGINDIEHWDEHEYSIMLYVEDILTLSMHTSLDESPLWKIDIRPDAPYITDSSHVRNRFANRRSLLNFLKTLKDIHKLQDPMNTPEGIAFAINDVKGVEPKGGEFYEFIKSEFGSWEEFRGKLNLRQLYDSH